MMKKNILLKKIPLYIKAPLKSYITFHNKEPKTMVKSVLLKNFLDYCNFSDEVREKGYLYLREKNYKYLSNEYKNIVSRYENIDEFKGIKSDENNNIWIFWWQGVENAPDIIRRCIGSIKAHAIGYRVFIVDKNNYMKYASVPTHILDKLNNNAISITHFSDYYRMALLAAHGGIWIDSSIYAMNYFNEELLQKPLFTIRNPKKDKQNISNWNWTVGVLGGWRGNILFCILRDMLSKYWKNNDYVVDYFMLDYMVKIVCDNNQKIKTCIFDIEENNSDFYFLQKYANQAFDMSIYNKVEKSSTWLYKISWKGKYDLMTTDGEKTFYSQWLEDTKEYGRGAKL